MILVSWPGSVMRIEPLVIVFGPGFGATRRRVAYVVVRASDRAR
jgi:hypothetical protein